MHAQPLPPRPVYGEACAKAHRSALHTLRRRAGVLGQSILDQEHYPYDPRDARSAVPTHPSQMALFVMLTDAQGIHEFSVEVLLWDQGQQRSLWTTKRVKVDLGNDPLHVHGWTIRLKNVLLPQPGNYELVLWCGSEVIARQTYQCDIHIWEPIKDGPPAPRIDWLRQKVDFIDAKRKEGLTTFVHCQAGVSRSAMVVTAYLMFKNNWTRDRALAFVRSKRPPIRPNPAFMKLLHEWERALGGKF